MAMSKPHEHAKDFFSTNSHFKNVFVSGDYPCVVNDINDLTGLCLPRIRSGVGQSHVEYERGIVVVRRGEDRLTHLETAVREGQMLCLRRVLPSAHVVESFIDDGLASQWLIETMTSDMAHYTMGAEQALDVIAKGDDQLFGRLTKLYGRDFDDLIRRPLEQMLV